jgi:hypothetical protein
VEEAALLMPVQRVVSGVQVENDLLGRPRVRLKKQVDEQPVDRRAVMADLVIARRLGRRVLEAVQRALAGERRAILAPGGELASEGREHRVVPQLIVVNEILVTQRDPEHPLRHHRRHGVLDLRLGSVVKETRREPCRQADRPIGGAEQQSAGIRGDLAAVERGHHLTALDHFITEQVAGTLCRHRGTPLCQLKPL